LSVAGRRLSREFATTAKKFGEGMARGDAELGLGANGGNIGGFAKGFAKGWNAAGKAADVADGFIGPRLRGGGTTLAKAGEDLFVGSYSKSYRANASVAWSYDQHA
jgi:hypothetical protein